MNDLEERAWNFIRICAENWDCECDEDATIIGCRCCEATKLMDAAKAERLAAPACDCHLKPNQVCDVCQGVRKNDAPATPEPEACGTIADINEEWFRAMRQQGKAVCGVCKFYCQHPVLQSVCRHDPHYEWREPTDWCGEFRRKEAQT